METLKSNWVAPLEIIGQILTAICSFAGLLLSVYVISYENAKTLHFFEGLGLIVIGVVGCFLIEKLK